MFPLADDDIDEIKRLYPLGKAAYQLGEILLKDDHSDIGYFSYRNRTGHYYKGKPAPHHPSPLHHWPAGIGLMMFGQLVSVMAVAAEAAKAKAEADQLFPDDDEEV